MALPPNIVTAYISGSTVCRAQTEKCWWLLKIENNNACATKAQRFVRQSNSKLQCETLFYKGRRRRFSKPPSQLYLQSFCLHVPRTIVFTLVHMSKQSMLVRLFVGLFTCVTATILLSVQQEYRFLGYKIVL